ncbi:MAG: hypothetical protein AAB500_01630 [Patescibacteria group bacterium]
MEQNFQTSFIPKKPPVPERVSVARPVGLLSAIAFLIFFTMLIATGGLYLYRGFLNKSISQSAGDLTAAKNRFEPSRLETLQSLDKRLRVANEILSSHIATSPIFEALEAITMKSVRYTKFGYKLEGDKNSKATVNISGVAVGYRAVALQSDLFTKNKNLIDPVFSNLTLDDKGNVLFDLVFSVDPGFINYKATLARAVPPVSPEAAPSVITQ